MLLGFAGLLRTMEIAKVKKEHCVAMEKGKKWCILLPWTKNATRTGNSEQVIIDSPVLVKFLAWYLRKLSDEDLLYEGGARGLSADLRWLGEKIGLEYHNLTPYLLRRSGATWHFTHFGKLDWTASLGRWAQIKTARVYINASTVALTKSKFIAQQNSRIKHAAEVARGFIA